MDYRELLHKLERLAIRIIDLDEMSPDETDHLLNEFLELETALSGESSVRKQDIRDVVDLLTNLGSKSQKQDADSNLIIEHLSSAFDRINNQVSRLALIQEQPPTPDRGEQEADKDDEDDEDSDESIFKDYLQEMEEYIEQLESEILSLEEDPTNKNTIHTVFRLFHSIKGTSGVMNHKKLNKIAHQTENLLEHARNGDFALDTNAIGVILKALDVIKNILRKIDFDNREEQIRDSVYNEVIDLIQDAIDDLIEPMGDDAGDDEDMGSSARTAGQESQPVDDQEEILFSSMSDEHHDSAGDEEVAPERPVVEQSAPKVPQIPRIDTPSNTPTPPTLTSPGQAQKRPPRDQQGSEAEEVASDRLTHSFVRVATNKLDNLIDLVGELVISANLVKEDTYIKANRGIEFQKKIALMHSVVSDLQKSSMALRMIPIGATFQKMKRVIRDYTVHADKSIKLDIKGADTEIDRNIVDQLYEPLVHMVRNCCDHGIEDVKTRISAGKPETGTITLDSYHRGNTIVIDVSDDGRGLPKEKILRKAIELKLIHGQEQLEDKDIFRLIMLPGFSTAEKITSISGRGVGMDVVNQTIKDLGGFIEIHSDEGRGSLLRISLPLTLAIMEGMLVVVGRELYVIPVINVTRIIHPNPEDVKVVMGKGELVRVGEALIPLVRLHKQFDIRTEVTNVSDSIVMIISSIHYRYALMVDKMLGIQDIVIKSLGPKFKDLKGLAGSTILGDGSIGLILDVNALYKD